MLKKRNKILTVGIIINFFVAILGIVSIFYVYSPLFEQVPYESGLEVTSEWVQVGFVSALIQTSWLILGAFMILNGIISTIGFVRKNNDLLLISISVSAIIFILSLIFSPTYGILQVILLLLAFITLLVGYILENKKVKNEKK